MTHFRSLSILTCAALFALSLAGCTAPQNPADFGPMPDNYQAIVTTWLQGHIQNAQTIHDLSMTPPVQDHVFVGEMYGGMLFGYKVCVNYDVQDAYGHYIGAKTYRFILKDGAVAHAGIYDLVNPGC
jgi:hypothetical protein